MKKLISILTSLTLLISLTGSYVDAVESEDPELYRLARSLGADTDCLKIVNYSREYFIEKDEETGQEYIAHEEEKFNKWSMDYLGKVSVFDGSYDVRYGLMSVLHSGSCVGISILEILSHNGVFSSSDIQKNAKKMSDITLDDDVDTKIFGYQWIQLYEEFHYYKDYLINKFSYEEQVDNLVKTAENCMDNGKYFLITTHTPDSSHAVCGIGITDGSWEFNGVKYDKCILTLDSNCVDERKNSTPFSNNCCIYINSETKQSYIPAYDIGDETEIAYSAIDDDTLLNYKGMINPSDTIDTDISSLTNFHSIFGEYNRHSRVYAVSENGEKYEYDDSFFTDYNRIDVYDNADAFRVEMDHEYRSFLTMTYFNAYRQLWIDLMNGQDPDSPYGYGDYYANIDISNDKISFENLSDKPLKPHIHLEMNDGSFDFSPYYLWELWCTVDNKLDVEVADKGMLIKPNGKAIIDVSANQILLDDDGNYLIEDFSFATDHLISHDYERHINTNNNILITVEDGNFVFLLDTNNDDVYDVPVQKGDVNFDGAIDASDASDILQAYAYMSIKQDGKIDKIFGDYNDDGIVDASDASAILAYYAGQMTNKKLV